MALIEVRGLTKIFGPQPQRALALLEQGLSKEEVMAKTGHSVGLYNVSLSIGEGEIFVIMGLSGSGKSTLIRCLNRLVEPTAGEIWLRGQNLLELDERGLRALRQRTMSMVFQRFGLLPHRTVLENVAYGLEVQKVPRREREERALRWLEVVGLKGWEKAYPRQLSGGMQQRVGIARALCTDPEILLMDEPFSALDPLIRREMQDELLALQSRLNKTIVFITHDLDEALRLGNRIAILRDGQVVQVGTPEEILSNPADDYVAEFTRDVNRSRVLTARSAMYKPRAVVVERGGPWAALRVMEEQALSSVFVVDGEQRFVGLVTVEAAVAAAQKGLTDLRELAIREVPTAAPDTYLEDLIPVAAHSKWPIAVLDGAGRLVGVIPRVAVLRALAGRREAVDFPNPRSSAAM
ncbi:MAG: glycine betaine/L-proline ABC transporter ATP-binding protein [Firmicutes bacterium]|nr:glycine betaine/L-proline ABC transporter ATP-binding protein [Bacillota bacterium]